MHIGSRTTGPVPNRCRTRAECKQTGHRINRITYDGCSCRVEQERANCRALVLRGDPQFPTWENARGSPLRTSVDGWWPHCGGRKWGEAFPRHESGPAKTLIRNGREASRSSLVGWPFTTSPAVITVVKGSCRSRCVCVPAVHGATHRSPRSPLPTSNLKLRCYIPPTCDLLFSRMHPCTLEVGSGRRRTPPPEAHKHRRFTSTGGTQVPVVHKHRRNTSTKHAR